MKYDFGNEFKKIRKNKGISQKKICENIVSRTTLSKMENGKVIPSIENFSYLLDKISMSLEEFDYICNSYSINPKNDILTKFFSCFSNMNNEELLNVKELSIEYLTKQEDTTIRDILSITEAYLNLAEDHSNRIKCMPKILVNTVWSRLQKMTEWYYQELRLVNCILFMFPLETIIEMAPRLIKSLEKYNDFANMDNVRISILLNISTIYLQNEMYQECYSILKFSESYIYKSKRFDYLSVLKVRLGICKNDKNIIKEGLILLELTDEKELLKALKKEISLC